MNKRLFKAGVVSVALLPMAGFAAIDDQGMQYVTAAEGLHGSLRVDILHSTDDDGDDNAGLKGGDTNSLRLWVNGSADLGGGMSSTYYWEVRDGAGNDGTKKAGQLGTQAWDVGVSGPFGDIEFGRLSMTAYRLVPSADLAFERGSERASFGCDPCDNGLRYESPSFNGFKFGVSGIMEDKAGDDDSVDEFSVGVKYESPIGLSVGAGYEVARVPEGTELTVTFSGVAVNPIVAEAADDRSGYRAGARYSQDNWLVGYEYRAYEGFWKYGTDGALVFDGNGDDTSTTGRLTISGVQWNPNAKYEVHAFGVQVKIDRITASANYSTEKQTNDSVYDGIRNDAADYKFGELGRDVFAVDAAYSLGSRSTMVLGWKSTETDSYEIAEGVDADNDGFIDGPDIRASLRPGDIVANGKVESNKVSEVYLFYRVDF